MISPLLLEKCKKLITNNDEYNCDNNTDYKKSTIINCNENNKNENTSKKISYKRSIPNSNNSFYTFPSKRDHLTNIFEQGNYNENFDNKKLKMANTQSKVDNSMQTEINKTKDIGVQTNFLRKKEMMDMGTDPKTPEDNVYFNFPYKTPETDEETLSEDERVKRRISVAAHAKKLKLPKHKVIQHPNGDVETIFLSSDDEDLKFPPKNILERKPNTITKDDHDGKNKKKKVGTRSSSRLAGVPPEFGLWEPLPRKRI